MNKIILANKFIFLIFALALILRLGFIFFYPDKKMLAQDPLCSDGIVYDQYALSFLHNGSFHLDWQDNLGRIIAPVYPTYSIFLSLIYFVFGHNFVAVRIIQTILSSLTCVIVYFITREAFENESVAKISALISVFYYPFITVAGYVMTEALFIFLLTSSVLLLIQAIKYSSSILYGLSGLGWGLAVLCRSIIWGFIPILIIYLFFILLKQRANFMKSFFVFIIGILLIIIPWSIRNYRVSAGIFSPAIGGWCMLYMGNNPLATGGGGGWLVLNEDMRVEDDIKEKINIVSISELENIFIKRALKFMLNNPKRTAVLAVKKFINMWRPYYPSARMSTKVILLLTDLMFIFPLGIIGMVLCRNKKWPPLFYLLIGYYFLIHLFLVAEIRHRLPIMPFLIIFSAYVLNKTLQRCCAGKSQSLS